MTSMHKSVELKNPKKVINYTYAISIPIITILAIIVHLLLDKVISEQSITGKLVNISGQQRMLSQRTALFSLEYLTTYNSESKVLALQALQKMQDNHRFLLSRHYDALNAGKPSPMSSRLQQMYFKAPLNVDQQLKKFAVIVNDTLAMETQSEANTDKIIDSGFMTMSRDYFLDALDQIVSQYEKEGVDKISDLRSAQIVILWIIILTILIVGFLVFRPIIERYNKSTLRLQQDANFDYLSGLLNRQSFNNKADQSIAESHQKNYNLGIIMFDIDFFKQVNDTHGHEAGDAAIKHVANILKSNCRETDYVARFGGEEFVMLLPQKSSEDCYNRAEKIRNSIKNSLFMFEKQRIHLTISAGVAVLEPDHSEIKEPLRLADIALYESKKKGRDKVTLYQADKN